MGNKIFVSYKYRDYSVQNINGHSYTKVRDYIDLFQNKLEKEDHIYKGEDAGEDLSALSDDAIWEKLKDRIYDSSVTIVFISPSMKENGIRDRDQWIPWEISYSLKEVSRKNSNGDAITSKSNAMIAVVLPDMNGDYSYYVVDNNCCDSGCRTLKRENLFTILKENMFNIKEPDKNKCIRGDIIYNGENSYIQSVKWSDFIENYNYYIKKAVERQERIDDYEIRKEL